MKNLNSFTVELHQHVGETTKFVKCIASNVTEVIARKLVSKRLPATQLFYVIKSM